MRVYVYFNLHKHLWSVRALEGPRKGRVIAHLGHLELADCVFRVSEAGRQRVLRERCKNVHAGIVGHLVSEPDEGATPRRLTYNPYLYDSFIDVDTKEPLQKAGRVAFGFKEVRYSPA